MSGLENSCVIFLILQLCFSLRLCLHAGLYKFLPCFSYCSEKLCASQNTSYYFFGKKKNNQPQPKTKNQTNV